MKTRNFKWLVVLCMTMGLASVAKAQIYCSEACFYAKAGSSEIQYVVRFDYMNDKAWIKEVPHSQKVRKDLAKSESFYDDDMLCNWNVFYEYDAQKSTSSRVVYRKKRTREEYPTWGGVPMFGMTPTTVFVGYDYIAFSTDMSSFIKWFEKKDNYDGSTGTKRYYSRVPKEDLLPKAVNYDFLND
ncbi:MAG: hypothetical protein MJ000_04920 [Bacteroidales bacterium]|nr:hypothetical protein [Bacteroidales bacterium]